MEKRLECLQRAGGTKRLHTVRTLQPNTVAEHVYGSLTIAVELCRANGIPPRDVMLTLLYHDAPEAVTGDIPAPVKRASSDINEAVAMLERKVEKAYGIETPILDRLAKDIVHAADTLDLAYTCLREIRMGNRSRELVKVFTTALEYVSAQAHVVGVDNIVAHLKKEAADAV